jgi:predicted transcriptional regulator
MKGKLTLLPKPAKVEAVKALKELDFTFEQIAKTLGIGERTAYRYVQEQTDEEWQEFGLIGSNMVSRRFL